MSLFVLAGICEPDCCWLSFSGQKRDTPSARKGRLSLPVRKETFPVSVVWEILCSYSGSPLAAEDLLPKEKIHACVCGPGQVVRSWLPCRDRPDGAGTRWFPALGIYRVSPR